MSRYLHIQILALAITLCVYLLSATLRVWLSLLFAMGFSHYLVSLLYSRRQLLDVLSRPAGYVPMLALLLGGWFLYGQNFSLALFFGVHHLFNEAYLKIRLFPVLRNAQRRAGFPLLLTVIHGSGYYLLVSFHYIERIYGVVLVVAFLVALGLYIQRLVYRREALGGSDWLQLLGGEVLILMILPYALMHPIRFEVIVFYHFVFWALLPLYQKIQSESVGSVGVYITLTLGSVWVFYMISPLGPPEIHITFKSYHEYFLFWSYFHITTAFFLSRAHPHWINRWFTAGKNS